MAILLKCGALFYHIPKTGGNWVTEVLEEQDLVFAHVGGKHSGEQLRGLEEFFRQPYRYDKPNRPFYKFCFVRHPLRWYESWFKMQKQRGWTHWDNDMPYWYPPVELNGLGSNDFNTFAANVIQHRPGFVSAMYDHYTRREMHFVGQQERLADDLVTVLKVLQVPFDEAQLRQHAPANVSILPAVAWNPDLEKRMLELEASGLQTYRYTDKPAYPFLPLGELLVKIPFYAKGTHGYIAKCPEYANYSDDHIDHHRSMLVVLENGVPLRKAHAMHQEIVDSGLGAFSHWQDTILFSTSDNTDPNTNKRVYTFIFRPPIFQGSLLLK